MDSLFGVKTQYFYELTPQIIDESLERLGLRVTGRVLALNSLENRVYEVELEDPMDLQAPFSNQFVVVKFYRPGRWKRESLQEEHAFLGQLHDYEIPVINPLVFNGDTLHIEPTTGLFYCVYPKVRGRLKDELSEEEIGQIGRLIGRIHNIGALGRFENRPLFHPKLYVKGHFKNLAGMEDLPQSLVKNYLQLAEQLYPHLVTAIERLSTQRIHGDVHRGNILWTEQGPWILDFDDCASGPREQDLWLLLPGNDAYAQAEREKFLEAYEQMSNQGHYLSNHLIEAFRTLRMIHFNGWVAMRYHDPSFQRIYPDFTTQNHWEVQVLDLKEQFSLLQETLFY